MKKQGKNQRYFYFKTSLHYLIKNQIALIIIFFLEFVPIYFHLIFAICKLQFGLQFFNENTSVFYYVSIYTFYKENLPTYSSVYLYVFFGIFILIIILYQVFLMILSEAFIENKNLFCEALKTFTVNFYELFNMRLLNIFFQDTVLTLIIRSVYEDIEGNNDNTSIIAQFIFVLFFIMSNVYLITHFNDFCIWSNIKLLSGKNTSYPFDMKFSLKYDMIMVALKILMIIEKNLYLQNEKVLTVQILFFNLFAIIIAMFYFAYMIYLIFFNESEFLYYQITNINIFKMFFILFTGISIVFRIIISDNQSYVFYLVNSVSILLFAIFFVEQFKTRIYEIFIKSTDMIGILMYLISNDIDDKLLISQWLINHKILCKKENCVYCNEMLKIKCNTDANESIDNFPLEKFYKIVWSILSKEIKNKKLILNKEKEMNVDGIELIYYFIKKNHQRLKFNILFYKKLVKHKAISRTFYDNLQLIFERVKELNMDFIKSYQLFEESTIVVNEFTTLFTSLDNFIKYEGKTNENVIKIAKKMYTFANNKNVVQKLTTNLANYSYEVALLRYLYELITHTPLKGTFEAFDITNFYEVLDHHFENDNIILINYDLIGQECNIVKACCELVKFINSPFEGIFPRYLKQFGKGEFVKLINQNNFKDDKNEFNFVMQNHKYEDDGFVESFQLKFVMYPSIDSGEVLISGEIKQKISEVMIISKIDSREFLVSFSASLANFFCITPEIIEIFAINQKFILTDTLFITKGCISPLSSPQHFKGKQCIINFCSYYNLIREYLEDTTDIAEKDLILKKLFQMKILLSKRIFYLNKQYSIRNTNEEEYIVYYVNSEETHEEIKNMKTPHSIIDSGFKDTFTKYMTTTVGPEKNSHTSTSDYNINRLKFRFQSKDNQEETAERKEILKIKSLYFFYSIYNLLVLCFLLVYLFVQLQQNGYFIEYFELYQKYITFRDELDVQILRLTSNLCIMPSLDQTKICINYFNEYSKKFSSKYPSNDFPDIYMNEYVNLEFTQALNHLQQHYSEFSQFMFDLSSNSKPIEDSEDLIEVLYINIEDGTNFIRKENETFYQGLNIYINFMTQIINENGLTKTVIRFFDYDGSSNVLQTGRNGKKQKNLYQIILNYPILQRSLNKQNALLIEWFTYYKELVLQCMIIFTSVLTFLNVVHLCLGAYSQSLCTNVFNKTIDIIITKLKSRNHMDYFQSKYAKMKTLINLYNDKPSTVIAALLKETDEYEKKELEKRKNMEAFAISSSKSLKKKEKQSFTSYEKTLRNLYISAYFIYIFLIIYESGLFFMMYTGYIEINTMILLCRYNTNIDTYLYNNLNSLQYVLLTNITEYQLADLILNDSSIPIIRRGVNDHLYSMKIIDSIRAQNAHLFNRFPSTTNFSCAQIRKTKDASIENLIALHNKDYYAYLEEICQKSSIMAFNDTNLIQTNIIYLEQKLINSYRKVNYTEKVSLMSNEVLWDLYSTLIIFNRIIREASNDQVLPNVLSLMFGKFQSMVKGCLISNVFIEFGILTILFYLTFIMLINTHQKIIILLRFLEGA